MMCRAGLIHEKALGTTGLDAGEKNTLQWCVCVIMGSCSPGK